MIRSTVSILAIIAMGALSGANAADIYNTGQSLKDSSAQTTYEHPRGGLGLRVFLGYSSGDRDVSQRNSGELGLRETPECEADDETGGDNKKKNNNYKPSCSELDAEATDLVKEFNNAGVDASWDGATFELPLLRALSSMVGGGDISTISGGVEAEYLVYSGPWAYGIVGGLTLYGDADSKTSYSGAPITLGSGALISPHGSPQVGMDTGLTTSGYVEMERILDLDLAFKFGRFVSKDTMIYGIAGPSLAKGKVKGNVNIDGTNLGMTYEDEQWSLGYVVGAGVEHYLDNGWSLNAQVDYKDHNFDASKSIDQTIVASGDSALYGKASSKSEVEDSIWTIKFGVARHW